jgi:hypothetical protein
LGGRFFTRGGGWKKFPVAADGHFGILLPPLLLQPPTILLEWGEMPMQRQRIEQCANATGGGAGSVHNIEGPTDVWPYDGHGALC